MKLDYQRFMQQLPKPLLPFYLISGTETLLQQDVRDALLKRMKQESDLTRQCAHVTPDFSCQRFFNKHTTIDLFTEKKLLDLRILTKKLNTADDDALNQYCAHPPSDSFLMLSIEKIPASFLKQTWYKTIVNKGLHIQIWPVNQRELPVWIRNRLHQHGFTLEKEALDCLVELTIGNLIAAHNTIEKIALLYPKGCLTTSQVNAVLSENMHASVFELVEYALQKERKKTISILNTLAEQGCEPYYVLWAIAHEFQRLHRFLEKKNIPDIRPKQQLILSRAATLFTPEQVIQILKKAHALDRLLKTIGKKQGIWYQLTELLCV